MNSRKPDAGELGVDPLPGSRNRVSTDSPEPWRVPWIRLALLGVVAAGSFRWAWNHPTGNDVIVSSLQLIAGVLSTPLLLEGAWFCLGAFVLYLYTLRRRHREGDEWVVMEVEDSLDPKSDKAPRPSSNRADQES